MRPQYELLSSFELRGVRESDSEVILDTLEELLVGRNRSLRSTLEAEGLPMRVESATAGEPFLVELGSLSVLTKVSFGAAGAGLIIYSLKKAIDILSKGLEEWIRLRAESKIYAKRAEIDLEKERLLLELRKEHQGCSDVEIHEKLMEKLVKTSVADLRRSLVHRLRGRGVKVR